jgi:hypothetical protein
VGGVTSEVLCLYDHLIFQEQSGGCKVYSSQARPTNMSTLGQQLMCGA